MTEKFLSDMFTYVNVNFIIVLSLAVISSLVVLVRSVIRGDERIFNIMSIRHMRRGYRNEIKDYQFYKSKDPFTLSETLLCALQQYLHEQFGDNVEINVDFKIVIPLIRENGTYKISNITRVKHSELYPVVATYIAYSSQDASDDKKEECKDEEGDFHKKMDDGLEANESNMDFEPVKNQTELEFLYNGGKEFFVTNVEKYAEKVQNYNFSHATNYRITSLAVPVHFRNNGKNITPGKRIYRKNGAILGMLFVNSPQELNDIKKNDKMRGITAVTADLLGSLLTVHYNDIVKDLWKKEISAMENHKNSKERDIENNANHVKSQGA